MATDRAKKRHREGSATCSDVLEMCARTVDTTWSCDGDSACAWKYRCALGGESGGTGTSPATKPGRTGPWESVAAAVFASANAHLQAELARRRTLDAGSTHADVVLYSMISQLVAENDDLRCRLRESDAVRKTGATLADVKQELARAECMRDRVLGQVDGKMQLGAVTKSSLADLVRHQLRKEAEGETQQLWRDTLARCDDLLESARMEHEARMRLCDAAFERLDRDRAELKLAMEMLVTNEMAQWRTVFVLNNPM